MLLALLSGQEDKLDPARIGKLVEQLGADFLEDRESARKALEKAGASAEAHLIGALGSSDYRVRKACVDLLRGMKSEAALPRLAEVFRNDDDMTVRDAAFDYLRQIGRGAEDQLIAALASDRLRYRQGAVDALTDMMSVKCAAEMNALFEREQDRAIKDKAFEYLRKAGKPAEPFLLKLLSHPDAAVRLGALRGLKEARSDEVLASVGKLFLIETDGQTLLEAYDGLRAAGEKSEPHFVAGLRSPQEQVRLRSIEGLQGLKSLKAMEPAAEAFRNDPSDSVRGAACDYLKSHGQKAEGALIAALPSQNSTVKILAIRALGEIRSEKPLAEIAALFRSDKNRMVHQAAFEYLRSLEGKAERELIEALGDEDKEIRRQAMATLGQIRSEAAIEELIRFMDFKSEFDPESKVAAAEALARIGPKAVEAVRKALEMGAIKKRSADAFLALYHDEEVQRLLDLLVTDVDGAGGSGYYEGMFSDLARMGREKVVPVLLKMLSEPAFRWRRADRGMLRDYELRMRELAIMALGEMGDASALEPLRDALRGLTPERSDSIYEEVVVALHRLGDKKPFEAFAARAAEETEAGLQSDRKIEACTGLFQLGLVQNRLGRRDDAEGTYLRILKVVEDHRLPPREIEVLSTVYYNLACLRALKGDKSAAMSWLRTAVEAGFRDRRWIGMDQDLASLRDEAGYRKLMADEKLFERKPED